MTTTPPPSVAVMKLTKTELIAACDTFREKALQEHQNMRIWMNRALLAESRLATLTAELEPEGTVNPMHHGPDGGPHASSM